MYFMNALKSIRMYFYKSFVKSVGHREHLLKIRFSGPTAEPLIQPGVGSEI